MSRCFIKFPIRGFRITQYITSIGLFYKNMGYNLDGVWLCEELVGVTWSCVWLCEELSGGYLQEFLHAEKYNNYAKEGSGDFNPPIFFPSPHSFLFVLFRIMIS